MDELDQALIALVSHNKVNELVRNGVQMEWIENEDAKVIYRIGLENEHGAKKIPTNRIGLLSASWGELRDQQTVKKLVSLNGTGEASAPEVANKLLNRYLSRNARQAVGKLNQLLTSEPHKASQYLPLFALQLEKLSTSGQAYDPRPSAHKGGIVPPILFRSRLQTYNKIFGGKAQDGGGYRKGWWTVWMGATGKGKTTHSYTMAVDAIQQDKKVAFISKENQERVRARILLGLTGLTLREIETEVATEQKSRQHIDGTPVMIYDRLGNTVGPCHEAFARQLLFDFYADKIEKLLLLYDWTFSGASQIKAIISAHHPDILNADFYDETDVAGKHVPTELGVLSREREVIAHSTQIHFNGFFQIAGQEMKSYENNDNHTIAGPYGSTSVPHFADTVIQTKLGKNPNEQHNRRSKCRLGGMIENWFMRYDEQKWIFCDKPEMVVPQSH